MVGSTAVSPDWDSSPQRLVFHVAANQVALNGGTMLSIAGPPKIQQKCHESAEYGFCVDDIPYLEVKFFSQSYQVLHIATLLCCPSICLPRLFQLLLQIRNAALAAKLIGHVGITIPWNPAARAAIRRSSELGVGFEKDLKPPSSSGVQMQFPKKCRKIAECPTSKCPPPQKKPAFRSCLSLAQAWHPEIHEGISVGPWPMAEDWGTKGPTIFFSVSWY